MWLLCSPIRRDTLHEVHSRGRGGGGWARWQRIGRPADRSSAHSAEFKREQIERALRGEVTAAELSRELSIARSQIQCWKHLLTKGGETAVVSDEDVVQASELGAAQR